MREETPENRGNEGGGRNARYPTGKGERTIEGNNRRGKRGKTSRSIEQVKKGFKRRDEIREKKKPPVDCSCFPLFWIDSQKRENERDETRCNGKNPITFSDEQKKKGWGEEKSRGIILPPTLHYIAHSPKLDDHI